MKPGLEAGQTAQLELTTTAEMRAQFGGVTVHDLFSTSALVHHMEWAARKTILPYLEPHEEGMGSHVEVFHLSFTPCGWNVLIRATVTEVRDRKIVCEVEAFNARGKIARGKVTQSIVERGWLEEKLSQMKVLEGIAPGQKITCKS